MLRGLVPNERAELGIATLIRPGAPRYAGSSSRFLEGGVWGSMGGISQILAPSLDAREVTGPPPNFHRVPTVGSSSL